MLIDFTQSITHGQTTRKKKATNKTREVTELYCLSVLMFLANPQCSMPWHVMLTDTVLCQSGSTTLVKILNRIGAISSFDTHSQLMTEVVMTKSLQLPQLVLSPSFKVVSVDNIDISQPYAAVYCGSVGHSWHGTSIQSVGPTPNSIKWHADKLTNSHCRNSEDK